MDRNYIFKIIGFILLLHLVSCSKNYHDDAHKILNKMTLDQKIGQMLMFAIPGKEFNPEVQGLIEKYRPGGVILFGYNISPHIHGYIQSLQKSSYEINNIPLFVSTDQEGGRVHRLIDGITQFPGNMAMGIVNDTDSVEKLAKIVAIELRKIGINMNLAPVLDVNNNPDNPVINTRSFGSRVDIVTDLGMAYIRGLQEGLCISVAKHFPGHGDTNKDSHKTLPVIPYTVDRLQKIEFIPFKHAVKNGVECIMTAHISYPKILKNYDSATISRKMLHDILRYRMGFQGVIITDDMEMNAISKELSMGEAAVKTVKAGADIVLSSSYGNNLEAIFLSLKNAVLNREIPIERINDSVIRILSMKLRYKIMDLKNGNIVSGTLHYSKKEQMILKKKDEINRYFSRNAIYYHGNISLLAKGKKRVVISQNPYFLSKIEKQGIELYSSLHSYLRKAAISKDTVVFYQLYHPDIVRINNAASICRKKGITFVVIITGNPFPVASIKGLAGMIATFSNTKESYNQLALCVAGKFKPKTKINVFMGHAENKTINSHK